jgi:hypothetical protein
MESIFELHPWISVQGSSPFAWSALGALAATTWLKLTTAVACPTCRIHPAILVPATRPRARRSYCAPVLGLDP